MATAFAGDREQRRHLHADRDRQITNVRRQPRSRRRRRDLHAGRSTAEVAAGMDYAMQRRHDAAAPAVLAPTRWTRGRPDDRQDRYDRQRQGHLDERRHAPRSPPSVGVYNVTGHVEPARHVLRQRRRPPRSATTSGRAIMDVANTKYGGDAFPEPDASASSSSAGVGARRARPRRPRPRSRRSRRPDSAGRRTADSRLRRSRKGTVGGTNPTGHGQPRARSISREHQQRPRGAACPTSSARTPMQAEAALDRGGLPRRTRRRGHATTRRRSAWCISQRPGAGEPAKPGDKVTHRPSATCDGNGDGDGNGNAPDSRLARDWQRVCAAARIALAIGAAGAAAFAWGSLVERTRFTLRARRRPRAAPPARSRSGCCTSPTCTWRRGSATSRSGCGRSPTSSPTSSSTPATTSATSAASRASVRAFERVPRRARRLRQRLERLLRSGAEEPVHVLRRPVEARSPRAKPPRHRRAARVLRRARLAATSTTRPRASTSAARTSSSSASTTRTGATTASTSSPRPSTSCAPRTRSATRRGPTRHPRAAPRPTVTVGVAHAPYQRVLNSFVNHGAQLMLAGHTHGGQVCVPGFGALVTNCDIPREQVEGPQRLAARAALGVPQRLGGPRHVDLRAGALRVPARGDAAHARSRGVAQPRPARRMPGIGMVGRPDLSAILVEARKGTGVWRSLVARVVRDDEVAGSNPVTPTLVKALFSRRGPSSFTREATCRVTHRRTTFIPTGSLCR